MRALERINLGVAIPREARVLRDGRALAGTLHRLVEGTPLRGRAPHGRSAQDALARDIAAFLSQLHAVPVERARRAGVREVDLWRDRYAAHIEEALPHLGPATQAWLRRMGDDFVSGGGSARGPRVLVHGDVSGAHLLLGADDRLSGVIDFGDALIADPALDFAGVLNDLPPSALEGVLAHYALPLDRDVRRRVAFYIAVAPLFQVVYGAAALGAGERRAGARQLAARAGAASRRARA